jgi:radical SAM superfamily enzyme YgiQ (UPF0313 family)
MIKGVIFANPPAKVRKGQKRRGMFPLPAIVLANSLNERVDIENASPDLLPDDSLAASVIAQSEAEWVAFTCYQETMRSVKELAGIAKSYGKQVILGGHHISLWGGERALKEIPEADFVVIGEGELPLKMLAEGVEPDQIPGLWWRKNDELHNSRIGIYSADWATQPPMIRGYSAFDYSCLWKRIENIGRTGYKKPFSVVGIRGCAYALRSGRRCAFCAMPLGNRLRCRLPEYFWEEIKWAVGQYGIDLIWEHSDSFLGCPDWLSQLAETRSQNTPPIWCYGRVDEITPETIPLMSQIGVEHIYLGIEVGSDERLQTLRKGITLEQSFSAVRLCLESHMRVQLSFIVGLPGETEESLNDTIDFALRCRDAGVDDVVFHEFILRKGVEWFEQLVAQHPGCNRVVLDQGELQHLAWAYFNPHLDRESAMLRVQQTIAHFPNFELTAWNI